MKYLLTILFIFVGCNDDRPYQQRVQDNINKEAVEVCVGNHIYYYINWGHSGIFAPKFGDDDKPVRCGPPFGPNPREYLKEIEAKRNCPKLLGPSPRATFDKKTKTWWSKCKTCNGTGKI